MTSVFKNLKKLIVLKHRVITFHAQQQQQQQQKKKMKILLMLSQKLIYDKIPSNFF